MRVERNQAWLFAFTDLAFLLLISISLIPDKPETLALDLSKMNVPAVADNRGASPALESDAVWRLWIYPRSEAHPAPFKLEQAAPGADSENVLFSRYISRKALAGDLAALKSQMRTKPLLIPEKTSYSEDLLFAASALGRVWDGAGRADSAVKVEKTKNVRAE